LISEFSGDQNALDPVCQQPGNPKNVVDPLLLWNSEQAMLCKVHGAGEVSVECIFHQEVISYAIFNRRNKGCREWRLSYSIPEGSL
jgi:hypothetical protein